MESTRSSCNLHLLGLRHLDGAVLRVFMQILEQNHQTQAHWAINDSAPPDLVLAHPHNPQARKIRDAGIATVWVVGPEEPDPDDGRPFLRRPLQIDKVRHVLESIHPAPGNLEDCPTLFPSTGLAFSSTARVHLQGWPPAALLAMHPDFERLAGLLFSHYLTPQELTARSRLDWEVCSDFLDAVHSLGQLDILAPPGAPTAPHAKRERPGLHASADSAHPLLHHWVGRLRHRFGLA